MNINKSNPLLLHPLNKWMKKKKWSWFPHQIETFHHVQTGSDVVVFAPTGAGKTLTGFINPIDDLIKLKKFKGLFHNSQTFHVTAFLKIYLNQLAVMDCLQKLQMQGS